MPDPAEIAVISSALPATLTFLYQRLDRLLTSRGAEPEPDVAVPSGMVGTLQMPLEPSEEVLRAERGELERLREALADYAEDASVPPASDAKLRRNMAQARNALEGVYSQRLTFAGEDRPASGPLVQQTINTVGGEAIGVHSDVIGGSFRVVQDVDTVQAGGKLVGAITRQTTRE